ncbi:hypothetical protein BofuT4_P146210.1 [Botrytis cinerea T4]|uniref:Uncharacterized protein n=1 Tax=Botryotinia fuckeliana (strain T4) TaxID=999810 RepID=G2YXV4_BOTF4|nr:hypothetical protein BofuT4_P146210.1 [Botrytis cinerea T4]
MKRYQEKKEGADYNKQPNLRRSMAIVAFSSFPSYAPFLSLNDQYQENKINLHTRKHSKADRGNQEGLMSDYSYRGDATWTSP